MDNFSNYGAIAMEKILEYLGSLEKIKDTPDIYLDLMAQIITWKQAIDRPLIQGIVGGQGTGKTTLCRILKNLLQLAGYTTVSLSLDDLYKTYQERLELQLKEPQLRWRGPPGTHDVQLGIDILDQIHRGNPQQVIALPRFDKSLWQGSGDRTTPELVTSPDIILFEGWFVGVLPRDNYDFSLSLTPEIVTESDRAFAAYSNQQLYNYLPLWKKLDRLILLYPEDYHSCLQWRLEAEQDMIALGKSGMTTPEITEFVKYFYRALHPELFISPLLKQPTPVDLVIPLNADHSFGKPFLPA